CVRVAEIAPTPISAPPPSPQKAITLIGSFFILPLRISDFRAADVPSAADPLLPSWVCIQGRTHDVLEYVVLATYMHPVLPRTIVRGPAAFAIIFITSADSQPWQVRWPEVKNSSSGIFFCPLNGSRFPIG